MQFSIKKPNVIGARKVSSAVKPDAAVLSNVDDSGTTARAYLKTAASAKENGNHKREAELLEKAIAALGATTPSILRRYAAALYKCGEYRAAQAIIAAPACSSDGQTDYVERLADQLEGRSGLPFSKILNLI